MPGGVDSQGQKARCRISVARLKGLIPAAQGAAVFAVEAYTFDKPVRYHLDYTTLRQNVDRLAAEQIVVTHMSSGMLSRLSEVEHPAAFDGMRLEA